MVTCSSMPNPTCVLHAPDAFGNPGEAQIFHIAQFTSAHAPLTPSRAISANVSQPVNTANTVARAVVTGLDVDIQALLPGTGTCTISDGRPGVPAIVIDITVTASPPGSLELASTDAVRAL